MIRESDEMGVMGGAVRIDERSDVLSVLPVDVWCGVCAICFTAIGTDGELLFVVLYRGDFCGCPGRTKDCVPLSAEREDLAPDDGNCGVALLMS